MFSDSYVHTYVNATHRQLERCFFLYYLHRQETKTVHLQHLRVIWEHRARYPIPHGGEKEANC